MATRPLVRKRAGTRVARNRSPGSGGRGSDGRMMLRARPVDPTAIGPMCRDGRAWCLHPVPRRDLPRTRAAATGLVIHVRTPSCRLNVCSTCAYLCPRYVNRITVRDSWSPSRAITSAVSSANSRGAVQRLRTAPVNVFSVRRDMRADRASVQAYRRPTWRVPTEILYSVWCESCGHREPLLRGEQKKKKKRYELGTGSRGLSRPSGHTDLSSATARGLRWSLARSRSGGMCRRYRHWTKWCYRWTGLLSIR